MRFFRPRAPAPLDADPTRRIRELEIVAARMMRDGFAGQYHAAFHGRGLEFSQVREYFPGDDVRSIDWNVTARSGTPYVKEFVEERDIGMVLVLDTSPSMSFGSIDRRKIEVGLELVAVLGFAAARNGDRVGLLTVTGGRIRYLPPRRGTLAVREVVRTAMADAAHPESGPLRLPDLVRGVERTIHRRGVIVVVSDLLETGDVNALVRLSRRHELIVIRITDPRERLPRGHGLVSIRDVETGEVVLIDRRTAAAGDAIRESDAAIAHLRARGIDVLDLATTLPYDVALVRFFDQRVRRRR